MPTRAPRLTRPTLNPRDPRAGQRLGPFRLSRSLGRGGFAPVWLAEELFGGKRLRDAAVKLFFLPEDLPPGSPAADRWCEAVAEEARALCRVEHPNVVRFYSLQRDDAAGLLGLAMEYVPGPSLEAALLAAGRLDEEAAVEAGICVAWALASVHDAGLLHRDVKPGNVIRGPTGYKLIDFGIFTPISVEARLGTAAVAESGAEDTLRDASADAPAGTPGYIAPECMLPGAQATPASDLFSLGVMIFRVLTGALPCPEQDTAALEARARTAGATPPEGVLEIVEHLLKADPSARPRHAEQVARRLESSRRRRAATSTPLPPRGDGATLEATGRITLREEGSGAEEPDTLPDLNLHPPLVGRGEALTAIRRAICGAQRGSAQVSILTGPMGIGRTRLFDAAIDAAGLPPARVLRARCAPERRQPLRPLLDALAGLPSVGALGLGLLLEAVERAAAPAGRGGIAGDGLEAIETALLEASADAPLLLAIDDLQWADASTLHLLTRLAGRAGEQGHLLTLAAVRDEPQPSPALSALIAQVGGSTRPELRRLRLRPLSPDEVRRVAQGVGPCALELTQAVARGAGGVPALVVHALLAWRELGVIAWRGDAWRAADERALREAVPGVADLLAARLAAWFEAGSDEEAAALRTLACVALHGGELGVEVTREVLGEGGAALEILLGADILRLDPERRELSFAQEMLRQAALNLTRHRSWFDTVHRTLLREIALRPDARSHAAFLAAGYERLGDAPRARRWLRRALTDAAAAGLFEEASALGDRVAAQTTHPHQLVMVELTVARAAIRGRAFEAARRRLSTITACSRGSGGDRRAAALGVALRICRLEVARGLGEVGACDATLLDDADALGDTTLSCEARLALAGVAPAAVGLRLAGEAIALAIAGGGAMELTARARRLEVNRGADRCDKALAEEDLRRALALTHACRSSWDRIHIEADLAILEADRGQAAAAIERLRRLCGEAERQGMRGQLRLMLHNLSALLLRTGQYAEAEGAAERVARMAEDAGDPGLAARARSVRAEALLRLGQAEEALALADEGARVQEESGASQLSLTLLRRADIKEALGHGEEALADARRAREVAGARGQVDLGLSARLWEALWLARSGRAGPEVVASALEEARNASVVLQPLTRRLMEEARTLLESEEKEG